MELFTFFVTPHLVEIVVTLVFVLVIVFFGTTVLRATGNKDKPQGPFVVPVYDADDDPLPEPAEKLPYVYYDKPVEQVAYTIYYYSPYLGKEQSIPFRPRKDRGKPFDNVRGIRVSENLVLLRRILFTSNFPDDIREMAKQYEGCFPTEPEIELIYAKFDEINQNLYECGEPLLKRRKYLYTTGDEDEDKSMNYCLNFANGQKSYADCDNMIGAVLVERIPTAERQADRSEQGDEFDVLCEVNGQKQRLPFSKRNLGKPIGIFPFKNSPKYLELDEVEDKKHTDEDVDDNRLLDEPFCDDVYKVKNRLNDYLKVLDKPVLDGEYLADSPYMRGCGWIISFDDKWGSLASDYYGGNQSAKLRYMGCFKGKCQR
ncbi:MAG: hypothetical protein IJ532_00495 [Alphaproteobacteria bacterium]|nr:hypothetical protein [Alphaproteobacteria bacterium]